MKTVLCVAVLLVGVNCQNSLMTQNDRILRPCATYDLNCIRRFFASHSKCHVMHGPVPNPMFFPHTVAYQPLANFTISTDNLYRTLNGRIEEFYVNRGTDRLVIAVEFTNYTLESNDSYIAYHRRGREPIINKSSIRIFILSVTVTMIVPDIDDLQIQLAEATAYFNTPVNAYVLGPEAFNGADPGLRQAPVDILRNGRAALQEGFITDSYQDILGYLQHEICDFGIRFG